MYINFLAPTLSCSDPICLNLHNRVRVELDVGESHDSKIVGRDKDSLAANGIARRQFGLEVRLGVHLEP